jgi:hypothetical protein
MFAVTRLNKVIRIYGTATQAEPEVVQRKSLQDWYRRGADSTAFIAFFHPFDTSISYTE